MFQIILGFQKLAAHALQSKLKRTVKIRDGICGQGPERACYLE